MTPLSHFYKRTPERRMATTPPARIRATKLVAITEDESEEEEPCSPYVRGATLVVRFARLSFFLFTFVDV